jgi:hypothetical protein
MNIFFFIVISAFSAKQDSRNADILRIEFSSVTRGYQESMVMTKDSITFVYTSPDRKQISAGKLTGKKEWIRLQETVADADWNTFDNLQSPTNKRAFDGAKHSSIIITTSVNGTHNHSFDDENPNPALTALMKCIKYQRSKLKK